VSAGINHLRHLGASRNADFVHAVSDLALIIFAATDESLAHNGMSTSEQTTVLGQVPSDLAG
jgi:hypothetical protein